MSVSHAASWHCPWCPDAGEFDSTEALSAHVREAHARNGENEETDL